MAKENSKKVEEQIKKYIASQPEQKRNELQELHQLTLKISPKCKLWFNDGKTAKAKPLLIPT